MLLLVTTLACGPEPIADAADTFSSGGRDDLLRDGQVMFTYERSVVINTSETDSPRLFLLEGVKTEDGYRAAKLGTGEIYSGLFDSYWTLVEECSGEMVQVGREVTFTTGGNPTCEAFAGTWHFEEKKTASSSASGAIPTNTACGLYTQCVCDLAVAWTAAGLGSPNPFSDTCAESKSLLSSGADDPGTCEGGRVIFSSIAAEAGLSVPSSCTQASP